MGKKVRTAKQALDLAYRDFMCNANMEDPNIRDVLIPPRDREAKYLGGEEEIWSVTLRVAKKDDTFDAYTALVDGEGGISWKSKLPQQSESTGSDKECSIPREAQFYVRGALHRALSATFEEIKTFRELAQDNDCPGVFKAQLKGSAKYQQQWLAEAVEVFKGLPDEIRPELEDYEHIKPFGPLEEKEVSQ